MRLNMIFSVSTIVLVQILAYGQQPTSRCLDTLYPSIHIETSIIRDAMLNIGKATGLQVCGYWDSDSSMEKRQINLERYTGREAMDALVSTWPEYEWFEGPGNVVLVVPHGALDDPDFFLNTIIEETDYVNTSLVDIINLLIEHAPKCPEGNLGMVIHGPSSCFESTYQKNTVFSAHIPRGTLLDHMNQVMSKLDGIMSWQIASASLSYQFVNIPVWVKTADLAEAEAYASSGEKNPEKLLQMYDKAASNAPLESLYKVIDYRKAAVHRMYRPQGEHSQRIADTCIRQLVESPDPALIGIQTSIMLDYADICIRQNNTDDVYAYFQDMAQQVIADPYLVIEQSYTVMEGLSKLEKHRNPGTDVFSLLRQKYAEDPYCASAINKLEDMNQVIDKAE